MTDSRLSSGPIPAASILVADPERESLREIRAILDGAGYRTSEARNGAEVVAAVSSLPPKVVLLERSLPDAESLELCRRLTADGSVRVILMSGEKTASDDMADALEAGAQAYLVKPFGDRELLAQVKAQVEDCDRAYRDEERMRSLQAIVRDVTERECLKSELEEARNFLDTVLEQSPVPMWIGDAEGTLIRTNRALRERVRATDEQLVGIYHPLRDPNVERAGLTDTIRRVLENKEPVHFKLWWRPEEYWGEEHGQARERCMETSMFPIVVNGKLQNIITQWVDVTEREHLEHELRKSEQRYLNLAKNVPGVIFQNLQYSQDPFDDEFTYISPAVQDIFGLSPEEVTRDSRLLYSRIHPDDLMAVTESVECAMESGDYWSLDFKIMGSGGQTKWIRGSASHTRQKDGNILWEGIFLDITDEKLAQESLRESEQRLQAVFDAVDGVPIQGYDKELNVIFWNQASERLYGFSKIEAIGKRLDELIIPEEERPCVIEANRRWHEEGIPVPAGELELIDKDGQRVQVYSNHILITNHRGEKEMFCIDVDLTELKKTEDALQKSKERQRLATRSAGIGIWDWDIEGGRMHWDQQMFRLYGVTDIPEEVSYSYWQDRVHPEDFKVASATVEGEPRGDGEYAAEFRVVWPNGTVRWIKAMAVAIQNEAGKPVRWIGANYDITEAKETEEALRLANQAKDEFLAVMSHDLRSPLNPILGFSSLLLKSASGEDAAMLGLIQSSGERMLALIDSLLEYARLDRSAVKPSVQRFNLLQTCQTVFTEASLGYEAIMGTFNNGDTQLSPVDETLEVNSDRSILMRILGNLLQNAYKYTEAGSVTFTLGQVTQAGDVAQFRFVIEDTGIGIPEELLPSLFDPFTQADRSYERSSSGVGLGLAICKRLIGLLGGEIEVSSQVGVGSRFILTLPLERIIPEQSAPEEGRQKADGRLILPRTLRVLIVDDEPANATMVEIMVKRIGGVPCIAPGGNAAIELCRQELFDVILMDLRMPEVNGFQATEHIRANGQLNAETPIVAATANVSTEIESWCKEVGMSGFLKKPLRIEELFQELSRYADAPLK